MRPVLNQLFFHCIFFICGFWIASVKPLYTFKNISGHELFVPKTLSPITVLASSNTSSSPAKSSLEDVYDLARSEGAQFTELQRRRLRISEFKLAIEAQTRLNDDRSLSALLDQCFSISHTETMDAIVAIRVQQNRMVGHFENLLTRWFDSEFEQAKLWLNTKGGDVGNGSIYRCLLHSQNGAELAAHLLRDASPDAGNANYVKLASRILAERKWAGLEEWIASFPGTMMQESARAGVSELNSSK